MITRDDLSPGVQAVQGMHAALSFAVTYPELTAKWHHESQVLVFLAVPDEDELVELGRDLSWFDLIWFREPDLGDQLTAIAVEPDAGRMLSHLPLALRGGDNDGRTPDV